jgi:hypothetical protein
MAERRSAPRFPVDLFFNKFLDGYPYLCRTMDASSNGVLVETYAEPGTQPERFPVELRFGGQRQSLWLWAKPVQRRGRFQALQFVDVSPAAKKHLLGWLARAE